MSSTLACAGLPDTDEGVRALLDRVLPDVELLGPAGRNRVVRWEDASGARLVLEVGDDGVVALLPSFRSGTTVLLGDLQAVNGDVAIASLLDADGEELTRTALALEQHRLLPRRPVEPVRASLTALGVEVEVFADAAAFASAGASLLDPDAPPGDPPEHWAPGWAWPPRVDARSYLSSGVFADAVDATAHARLAGVVLHAERRLVQATGAHVVVAEVESAGFTVTVALEGAAHPRTPAPGTVLAGTVFTVACLEQAVSTLRQRRWWSRA